MKAAMQRFLNTWFILWHPKLYAGMLEKCRSARVIGIDTYLKTGLGAIRVATSYSYTTLTNGSRQTMQRLAAVLGQSLNVPVNRVD